jgi:hypothetical protein
MRVTTTEHAPAPHFATAGVILEGLAARDFARLVSAMDSDARMEALLPRGLRTCNGVDEIRTAFEGWFGDAEEFAVAEASVGSVGPVLQLTWRLSVRRAGPDGAQRSEVEQHLFVRTHTSGLVDHIALVCSGFVPETDDG